MKKPKKNPRGRFVIIYQDMRASAAWESLDGNAQALYMHIAARYNGKNNGEIPFSVREAAQALNASKDTAARAFKNLIDRGLITLAKRSGFNLKRGQERAAEYRLTEYPCDVTGRPATCKFKKWRRGKNGGAEDFSPEGPTGLTRRTDRSHQKDRGKIGP
jgi:helix-turn-helix protein